MARNWISTTTSRFLSTLSLRRATALDRLKSQATVISIHALLAESDRRPDRLWRAYHGNFYPRSPCGERLKPVRDKRTLDQFLSTLSLRRATYALPPCGAASAFLSTLSLRRATRPIDVPQYQTLISIHALLAESDGPHSQKHINSRAFLSTLSLRRATHAPSRRLCHCSNFYPRSPCGERRAGCLRL